VKSSAPERERRWYHKSSNNLLLSELFFTFSFSFMSYKQGKKKKKNTPNQYKEAMLYYHLHSSLYLNMVSKLFTPNFGENESIKKKMARCHDGKGTSLSAQISIRCSFSTRAGRTI
jgi:hypothetical protein